MTRWHAARSGPQRMDSLHRLARPLGIVMLGLGVAGGLASLGCSPEDPPRPVVEAGFWDEGRTETAMVVAQRIADDGTLAPIAEGDALRLDFGPQGGSHVEIEVAAEGVDVATTRMGARLEREDGTVVAEAFYDAYYGEPASYAQRVYVQAFGDTSGPLLLRVRVRDGAGVQATTEIGVSVR